MFIYKCPLLLILLFFHFSYADCPDRHEFKLKVEGWNPKSMKVTVSSLVNRPFEYVTKNYNPVYTNAYIYEFNLENSPPSKVEVLKISYDKDLWGEKLKIKFDKYLGEIKNTSTQFRVSNSEPEKMQTIDGFRIHSKKYVDPRGNPGFFVLERFIGVNKKTNGKDHFKLSYQDQNQNNKYLLSKKIFEGSSFPISGISISDNVFVLDTYLVGLSSYCGEPVVWSYKLKNSTKVISN